MIWYVQSSCNGYGVKYFEMLNNSVSLLKDNVIQNITINLSYIISVRRILDTFVSQLDSLSGDTRISHRDSTEEMSHC